MRSIEHAPPGVLDLVRSARPGRMGVEEMRGHSVPNRARLSWEGWIIGHRVAAPPARGSG
eukprot:5150150-Pyramimonas_sp.AAC.1